MVRARCVSLRSLVVLGTLCLACSGDPYGADTPKNGAAGKAEDGKIAAAGKAEGGTPAAGKAEGGTPAAGKAEGGTPAAGKPGDGKAAAGKPPAAVPSRHEDGKPLARVLEGKPLPLVEMLGQAPAKVESYLGPPLPDQKGGTRKSCVRYLPERTWFHCQQVWQRYSDKTETFGVVHVVYEDGKATALSVEKIPGAGTFSPKQALRKVGLELPGTAKLENPEQGVTIWSWFNSEARLIVHGRQYRVRVSVVDGQWDTAKVEIILNDALNENEKARMFIPGGEGDVSKAG